MRVAGTARVWVCGSLGLVLSLVGTTVQAQMPGGVTRNFSLPVTDRDTLKVTAMIRGEEARPVGSDIWELTGLRLTTWSQDGRTNLVARADRCRLLMKAKRLESADPLEAETGDGSLRLTGQAFAWEEATGLVASNGVEAVIARPATRPGAVGSEGPVRITSSQFAYAGDTAAFSPDVRVVDERGEMTCRRLVVELAAAGGETEQALGREVTQQVRRIRALDAVRCRTRFIDARADEAQYDLAAELLVLTGAPTWRAGPREGSAGRIEVERESGTMRARDDVRVRMPSSGLVPPGGLLAGGAGERSEGAWVTNRWFEVRSDALEVAPEAGAEAMNAAVFSGRVVGREQDGQLECGRLTVRYREVAVAAAGGTMADPTRARFEPVSAWAEESVVLTQSTNRVTCSRAVYLAVPAEVRMEGPVAWWLGPQQGQSESLRLDGAKGLTEATGDVRLRLPAGGLGGPGRLLAARGVDGEPETKGAIPVAIRCGRFVFERGDPPDRPGRARFEGGVIVSSGADLEMVGERMEAELSAGEHRVEQLEAVGGVELRAGSGLQARSARGDRAWYRASDQVLRLTGAGGVTLRVAAADGPADARGGEAVYDAARDVLELRDPAELVSARGTVTGDRLVVNRGRRQVLAGGMWKIRMPVGGVREAMDAVSGQRGATDTGGVE